MQATMIPLGRFVREQKVSMTAEWIAKRPDALMSDMQGANHYRCILRVGGRQMTLYYSMGSAHTTAPTVEDVLNCLALDAAGSFNAQNFEDWASELGYDTDSRKAENIFKAMERQARKLQVLFGEPAYQQLLFNVERQ